jgi:hypothetical protein
VVRALGRELLISFGSISIPTKKSRERRRVTLRATEFCCVQSVQSRHRVRKRDHVIASKSECGDSLIGKIGFVMNNDNAGGHKRAPFAGSIVTRRIYQQPEYVSMAEKFSKRKIVAAL